MPVTIICEFIGCLLPADHDGYEHATDLARLINHRFDRLENHMSELAAEQAVEAQAITDLGTRIADITGSIQDQIDAAVAAQAADDQAAFDAATAEAKRQVDVLSALAPEPVAPRPARLSTENDLATPAVDGVGVPLSAPPADALAEPEPEPEPQPDEAPPADEPAEGTDSVPQPADDGIAGDVPASSD